jgi:biotin/methionine sulfoxide reductase
MADTLLRPHSSHWGAFRAGFAGNRLVVQPHPGDPDPNGILQNFPEALRHPARIARPMVRRGWLTDGPGADDRRGRDEYVALPWDELLDRLGAELARIRDTAGPDGVFGGSYGWSSAGRFHHAQSQVHRFLNCAIGGYVRSVNSYSAGASSVILPHIAGTAEQIGRHNVTWEQVAEHSEVVLAFGGMALKNSMVGGGGVSRHIERGAIQAAAARGCRFILVGPLRDDLPEEAGAAWLPITPNTDTALMLALCHVLLTEGLYDRAFIEGYTAGFDRFAAYLRGTPCTPDWAAAITGIPAERIVALARSLPGKRSLITVAHGLQRAEFGEQPVWAGLALAAMLGQIGLPGGGYNYALGALAHTGRRQNAVSPAALPQGRNRCAAFIPVARISDMLLNPGGAYEYNGESRHYPAPKLVYWAGGNPFHHHQDLARLSAAFRRVETLVVHEIAWTATARHADIVLPVTMTLEREDIGSSQTDPLMVAMHRIAAPYAEARDDFTIFTALAQRLGCEATFTEGRDALGWLRHLYGRTRDDLRAKGYPAPSFEEFWAAGEITLPQAEDDGGIFRAFRDDPVGAPLATPSGRIELYSEVIAGFGYDDCPGHPAWLAPSDVPNAEVPLRLVANQPATRLHSQFDFGGHSIAGKRRGREVVRMHPSDAAARGIAEGDIVRLHNARGACLATAALTEAVMPGVVNLPTGAWYDPADPAEDQPLCVHGNPNVLTRDIGTSRLAQGCTGQLTSVEVTRFTGNLPPVRAFDPPVPAAAAA